MKKYYLPLATVLLGVSLLAGSCVKLDPYSGSRSIICKVTGTDTKGATISTNGGPSHSTTTEAISTNGFVLAAYAEDEWHDNTLTNGIEGSATNPKPAGLYFKKNVTHSSAGWKITDEPTWINGVDITFWSWNAAAEGLIKNLSYTAGTSSDVLAFDYELPASTAGAASQVDATNQKDIMIAYNSERRSFKDDGTIDTSSGKCKGTSSDEKINIRFYHALSEVLFAVSPNDGKYDQNIKIKSICIKNVYAGGHCVVTGSKLPSTSPSDPSQGFVWTYGSDTQDHSFAQDYNADFSGFNSASPQGFLPKPTSETVESQSSWHGGTYSVTTPVAATYSIYACNNKFFMIPQSLPSTGTYETVLSVTFDDGGVETTQEASIGGDTWKAGYYYKYKINYQVSGELITFSVRLVNWGRRDIDYEI